jgi:hypothetical protein
MIKQPSLFKIMTIDYIALTAFLFPVVSWGFYIALLVFKRIDATDYDFPAIAASITVVAIVVLAWRIRLFYSIFTDGIEAPATISNIMFFRDRGRVDYIYTIQGEKFSSGNAIHKVKQTRSLQVGEQVIVMVDRNNLKRAFIRDLYM